MKFKILAFLMVFLVITSVAQTNTAQAHRCKPDSTDFIFEEKGPFPKDNCLTIVDNRIVIVDCEYEIYQITCVGVWCDLWDNSMYVESDCTIDDQPPGNVPIWLPVPCGSPDPVSYMWQTVVNITGEEGCSAICWYCLPWEVPTKSLAEARCTTIEP